MKPLHERLNDRLEQVILRNRHKRQYSHDFILPTSGTEHDPPIDELVALAQSLQAAPQLEVAPDYTKQLQLRLLHRHTQLKLKRKEKKQTLLSLLRTHLVFSTVLGFFLLFGVLSASVLALATHASNPNNPLYSFKLLEQHFQVSLAGSASNQATLDLQFARERLNTLPELTDAAHAEEYHQALLNLDQRIVTATSAIHALPVGPQRTQLTNQLVSLQADAIHNLRKLLPQIALSEHIATTDELARLGDTVPHLVSATLTLPSHPNKPATIVFIGNNIQAGAQLLVNGKLVVNPGTLSNGQMIFVIEWHGNQHPQTLGLLNLDGTATQVPATIIKATDDNKHGDNGDKNGTGNGNKPTITPTPHHEPTKTVVWRRIAL
jgi:hypothetical protein